ncbi:hypothetical protein AB1285_20150, partial [Microbacterium sp. NRRL B-14842]
PLPGDPATGRSDHPDRRPRGAPVTVRSHHGSDEGRIDLRHTWLDPIIVVGPWVLTAVLGVRALRRLGRRH